MPESIEVVLARLEERSGETQRTTEKNRVHAAGMQKALNRHLNDCAVKSARVQAALERLCSTVDALVGERKENAVYFKRFMWGIAGSIAATLASVAIHLS